jgi:hypothetical protein
MGGAIMATTSGGRVDEYKGELTTAVFMVAILAASGGLLFG